MLQHYAFDRVMCLSTGNIVGSHYEIIEPNPLGDGGFGVTYKARDTRNNSQVALKQIDLNQQNNNARQRSSDYINDLEREAEALSQLRHDRIPQFFESFREGDYYYIVQQYIEGQDLSKEIIPGIQLSETQAIQMLREILKILQFVHSKNIIHRDIKPANLIRRNSDNKIVLIDFGAVKEIRTVNTNNPGVTLTRGIGTDGYMPGEQAIGNPQFNSDIYALGIILMQAVTGFSALEIYHPDLAPLRDNTGNYIWQNNAPQISIELKQIISRMIQDHFNDRYQSAGEVLQDLDEINNPIDNPTQTTTSTNFVVKTTDSSGLNIPNEGNGSDKPKSSNKHKIILIAITLIPILALTSVLSIWLWNKAHQTIPETSSKSSATLATPSKPENPACTLKTGDNISCGEEILYGESQGDDRKLAAESAAKGEYQDALKLFKTSWQRERREAETLIYMNNAFLEVTGTDYYTLAVSVPINYEQGINARNYELGQDILRGIAQLQTEVNSSLIKSNPEYPNIFPRIDFLPERNIDVNNKNPKGLKIVIVDDRNNASQSQILAPIIVSKSKILGLIGLYASNTTLASVDIYEEQKLPQISFGTTTIDLTIEPRENFSRVVYTNVEEATAIVNSLDRLNIKEPKIAIFSSLGTNYSKNLRLKIKEKIKEKNSNINIVKDDFNLANDTDFSPNLALQNAKQLGANIFILLPDGQETNALYNSITLIEQDNGNTVILGNNPLLNPEIEGIKNTQPLKLFAAAFWHPLVDPNGEFTKDSEELWGEEVNGNTAMAYDAALAFVEAIKLQENPTRENILTQLKDPSFSFIGATGEVKFNTPTNGDRVNFSPTLVHLVPCQNGDRSHKFVPIDFPEDSICN